MIEELPKKEEEALREHSRAVGEIGRTQRRTLNLGNDTEIIENRCFAREEIGRCLQKQQITEYHIILLFGETCHVGAISFVSILLVIPKAPLYFALRYLSGTCGRCCICTTRRKYLVRVNAMLTCVWNGFSSVILY